MPDDVRLTASFGVCLMKDAREPIDTILHLADNALYEAKRSGRNRVVRSSRASQDALPYLARQARA